MTQTQPWTRIYRPTRREEFVGNERAVEELDKWIDKWEEKPPRQKAVFLYGPPGVGKTSVAQVLAFEHGYEIIEINASDKRNKGSIEDFLGNTVKQNVTIFGRRRMIVLDEMDGLSGSQDRGGISAIVRIIDEANFPIILIANTIEENMGNRFRSVLRKAKSIEFRPLKSSEIVARLERIARDNGIAVQPDVLDQLAVKSKGDLRSAINDFEAIARGTDRVTLDKIDIVDDRDRLDYTPNILNRIFTSRSLWEARKTIDQCMISYDDLYDWIYENLPIVLDDPYERLDALEKLAKADTYQNRARAGNWRLLKYMFDLMTGGIAFSRKNSKGEGYREQLNSVILGVGLEPSAISTAEVPEGVVIKPNRWLGKPTWNKLNKNLRSLGAKWTYGKNFWILPYYREPQTKWRYIYTYHQRRRLGSVVRLIAAKCHTSTDTVKREILPLIRYMIEKNEDVYNDISEWMKEIPSSKLDYLRFMSFDKGPRDFVHWESYSRYKQREINKMIDKIREQKERDLTNIERWLESEKEKADWN